MVTYRLNNEEVALVNGFRMLTTRQREMILKGVIGVAHKTEPLIRLSDNVVLLPQQARA